MTSVVLRLDTEWLLSTLFDASLLSTFKSRQKWRLFFCLVVCGHAVFAMETISALDASWLDSGSGPRNDLFIIKIPALLVREALTMSDQSRNEAGLVVLSERLTNSAAFNTLFREGMDLVEETAAYLDGAGRAEAKALERSASLVYATESMRLTTRLMQLASWLLLHRAVKEGEMTLTQANREKTKVKLTAADPVRRRHARQAAAAIAGPCRALDGACRRKYAVLM